MYEKTEIGVIGAGSWGTTIANLLSEKGFKVKIWAKEREVIKSINEKNENDIFLRGIKLHKKLKAFKNIEEIFTSNIIIVAVPTQYIRATLTKYTETLSKNKSIILSLAKGIELNTFERPSEILKEIFKKDIYVLSGPNFAIEIAQKKPAASTVAGKDKKIRKYIQRTLNTEYFRVYENDDVIGTEIGGAVKNVIAIAAGMADALELGNNAKAALITRGLNEIRRLGKKLGAKDITFLGLSGMGDLILTCNSKISRNYTFGYLIGKGEKKEEILTKSKYEIEGVKTAKALKEFSKTLKIEMPISNEVYYVIYENKKPQQALKSLMNRKLKEEFYDN